MTHVAHAELLATLRRLRALLRDVIAELAIVESILIEKGQGR